MFETMPDETQDRRVPELQHEVAGAALSGIACDEIEERIIGRSSATEAEKTALRLFACSFYSRFELRRLALERLRVLSRDAFVQARQLPLTADSYAATSEVEVAR